MKKVVLIMCIFFTSLSISFAQNHFLDSSFATNGELDYFPAYYVSGTLPVFNYYWFGTQVYLSNSVFLIDKIYCLTNDFSVQGASGKDRLVSIDTNGTANPSFSNSSSPGLVILNGNNYHSLLQQSNGKLIVLGTDTVSRYLLNGNIDSSFGNNGIALINRSLWFAALQSDDKIVYQTDSTVERLTANGFLDTTFQSFWIPSFNGGPYQDTMPRVYTRLIEVNSLDEIFVFRSEGRLTNLINYPMWSEIRGIKLGSNGQIDTSFKYVLIDTVSIEVNTLQFVKSLTNGKLLIELRNDSSLTCILPDGSIDNSFGVSGHYYWPQITQYSDHHFVKISERIDGSLVLGYNTKFAIDSLPNQSFPPYSYNSYAFNLRSISSDGFDIINCSSPNMYTNLSDIGATSYHLSANKVFVVGNKYFQSATTQTAAGLNISRHFVNKQSASQSIVLHSNDTLYASGYGTFYQWMNCDSNNAISGAINNFYVPNVTGNYAVIATDTMGCDTSDCFFVQTISINTIKSHYNFRVYPNPNSGSVNIEMGIDNIPWFVEILDLNGRIIESYRIETSNFLFQHNLPAGIYLIRAKGKRSVFVYKMIVSD